MNVRQRYLPIIQRMTIRIDIASKNYVQTGNPDCLNEYRALVDEMLEIKLTIINSELETT